jgi:uncharacterized protein (UPF0335 family)
VAKDKHPGVGHNSEANKRLESIVQRWERLQEEKVAITSDQKDILAEAKSAGYDPKVIRLLLRIRKMDPADYEEQQMLLQTYARAIGLGDL